MRSTSETARKLIGQLVSVEVSSLAFCRLLERWRSGEADPSTPGRRQAALRRAADRVETALAGLERPLGRYLLELEADHAEGRSWFGEPGPAELVDWEPVLERAGVRVAPHRVAAAYLELAVLVRALEGLSAQARWHSSIDKSSLWAGLFDLRENLLGRAHDDLERSQPAPGVITSRLARMAVELTVVGSINLDLVARVERLPRPGETISGTTFERFPGGKGANQAVAAARLGAQVRLVGAVGARPARRRGARGPAGCRGRARARAGRHDGNRADPRRRGR